MSVTVSTTTSVRIDALVKCDVVGGVDNQGRRELSFTEADAKSLMHGLADTLGYEIDLTVKP